MSIRVGVLSFFFVIMGSSFKISRRHSIAILPTFRGHHSRFSEVSSTATVGAAVTVVFRRRLNDRTSTSERVPVKGKGSKDPQTGDSATETRETAAYEYDYS
jgi:hypothetical protein